MPHLAADLHFWQELPDILRLSKTCSQHVKACLRCIKEANAIEAGSFHFSLSFPVTAAAAAIAGP